MRPDGERPVDEPTESTFSEQGTGDLFGEAVTLTIPERGPGAPAPDEVPEDAGATTGERIGTYRILREIGQGGMGKVYLAARDDAQFRKLVAIKLVARGLASAASRRFRIERQILATLDHPNIARLLDGGATDDGLPYFVMEYVEGKPIDTYCAQHGLSIKERLELFRLVCSAVQHAHRSLVIHRDIKPGNILVTADGTPKLLDFGIAKLLKRDGGESTLGLTQPGDQLMTPAYASPEQVRGEPITTASDVYSLGVLLYELLTGRFPYRFADTSLAGVARAVCVEEPERPSTAVGRTDTAKGALTATLAPKGLAPVEAPEKLRRQLAGDLDTIVLMALRKEPDRRYGSVEQLSEDIRRYLEGLPVTARRDTFGYRATKFVSRNRVAVASGALVLVALVAGITVAGWQARVATAERGNAEVERARAELRGEENRRLLYASDMNLAQSAWEAGNVARVVELLERHRPDGSQQDLRGFEWNYLWRLCHRDLFTLRHEGVVFSISMSPDGRLLAAGTGPEAPSERTGSVVLWDVASRALVGTLRGHTGAVDAVAFSPDGRTLASGSLDGTVKLWDVASSRELLTVTGHSSWINGVAFSPDGTKVASAGGDGTAKLWDAATGRLLATLEGHGGWVNAVAFSPDGTSLVTASLDGTAKLWDAATARERRTLEGHSGWVHSAAFAPDGSKVVTTSVDATAKVWAASSGRLLATLEGHTGQVTSARFSPDGTQVVTTGEDGAARLWDAATGAGVATIKGHTDSVNAVAFSSDGKLLATGGRDKTVRFWSRDAKREWEVPAGHEEAGPVLALAFSPDGASLATAGGPFPAPGPETTRILDLAGGRAPVACEGHTGTVTCVAFAPDGRRLATGSADGTAKLWDTATGRELTTLRGHTGWIWSVAFSPDGRTIATASGVGFGASLNINQGSVKVWDVAGGQELSTLEVEGYWVASVAFSPDGGVLAAGLGAPLNLPGEPAPVKLWDLASGREIATLDGHTSYVAWVAFSPAGDVLATAGFDRTVRLWDVATWREVAVLKGHRHTVRPVVFSPDGRRLAAASWDATVTLWDVASRQALATLKGHRDIAHAVAFSPDGTTLATGGQDGAVKLWRAPVPGP